MSVTKSTEALLPYLNPEYWDGHSLGYGDATGEWPDFRVFGRDLRHSKRALEERITRMSKAIPIETYHAGEVFDAEDYDNGTLVIYNEESLRGRPENMDQSAGSLRGKPLPVRPTDTSPNFGPESNINAVCSDDEEIRYFATSRWGIVGRNKKGGKELHTISTGMVFRRDGERAVVTLSLTGRPTPIKVGETNHHMSAHSERLSRVNLLDVVAYGETEKKKRSLGRLAARLVPGHEA